MIPAAATSVSAAAPAHGERDRRARRPWRALARLLPWALLLAFGMRGLLAMRADGTTVDEPAHLAYGERALVAGTFERTEEAFNSKMPVSVLNALPVVLASRGRALPWGQRLLLGRLPTLALGILLGYLVWRWARELFGAAAGIAALLLYTCCPNILAHSHLITTDAATALGMFAATYCFWRYLSRPSRGRLLATAAVFGLAQLAKATAAFLLPIFAIILAIRALRSMRRQLATPGGSWRDAAAALTRRSAQGAALLLACGVAAVLVINLGFGFAGTLTPLARQPLVSAGFQSVARIPGLRDLPLPLPTAYVQGLDMVARDAAARNWSYLRGSYSETGFRSYFLWAFLVKVPLATQLLLLVAVWLAVSGRARAPGAEEALLVPPLFLLAYLCFFLQLDIGFRYLLPALPFLFVFAARVARPAATAAAAAGRAVWQAGVLGALFLWLGASSLAVHPQYLAYFNEIAGGPTDGSAWLIDSNLDWGQDGEAVRRLAGAGGAPLLIDPSGPVAGRIAVSVSDLVGRDPAAARRHAWLRSGSLTPEATVGYSWKVFEVTPADLERCCPGQPRDQIVDDAKADLALRGEPLAGGDGVAVRLQQRLNDGLLGANDPIDAARTTPPRGRPVRAWFGVAWPTPQTLGRVVAYPGLLGRGPLARKFLAIDYVLQSWDGAAWRDVPGTRVRGNEAPRIEHRFPPVVTSRIRLLIDRERNDAGTTDLAGGFRAACREMAAYRE